MTFVIKSIIKITNNIKEYFNNNLHDIDEVNLKQNKLYICVKNKKIVGSFFINTKYSIVKEIFIIEKERKQGYCKLILDYLKKNFLYLYFDVYYNNIPANKCYSKYLLFDRYLPISEFYLLYGYKPNPVIPIIRYKL